MFVYDLEFSVRVLEVLLVSCRDDPYIFTKRPLSYRHVSNSNDINSYNWWWINSLLMFKLIACVHVWAINISATVSLLHHNILNETLTRVWYKILKNNVACFNCIYRCCQSLEQIFSVLMWALVSFYSLCLLRWFQALHFLSACPELLQIHLWLPSWTTGPRWILTLHWSLYTEFETALPLC